MLKLLMMMMIFNNPYSAFKYAEKQFTVILVQEKIL